MADIKILEQKDTDTGWEIKVNVDELDFTVSVDKQYWQELTSGKEEVGDLVRQSFQFLLENEPKESILRQFNLRDIERYFPNYKEEIKLQGRQKVEPR